MSSKAVLKNSGLVFSSALALMAGCQHHSPSAENAVQGLTGTVTLTLAAPKDVPPLTPVLLASNSLEVRDGAHVNSGSAIAMGTGGLVARADAALVDAWSVGPVSVLARAAIRGTLHASNRTVDPSATVHALDASPTFTPNSVMSWQATFPASASTTDVALLQGQSQPLAPGAYRSVTIYTGAMLTLSTGTYYLSKLDLEPSAKMMVDDGKGPVMVYVSDVLIHRGAITSTGGGKSDILLGYLGTSEVVLESVFRGALVAPAAKVTLRAVGSPHIGYIAGKTVSLDAHAEIQYAAPTAIGKATAPRGADCRKFLQGIPEATGHYAEWAIRYCDACYSPDDTDRDGYPDCADDCPYDVHKVSKGACGCNVSDEDWDGDGVPNCLDGCLSDPVKTSPGQCGCNGEFGPRPLGATCTDTAGPESGAVCSPGGQCGNPQSHAPAAGCRLISWRGTAYWFCGAFSPTGRTTRTGAQAACSAKGLSLLRINSQSENDFLTSVMPPGAVWLGGNSLTTPGSWRWSLPNNNNGDVFWSGGASGAPVASLYSNWKAGSPGVQRCAVFDPTDGRWVDASCTQTLGYICVYRAPLPPSYHDTPPGQGNQPPPSGSCLPQDQSGLPEGMLLEQLKQQIDDCTNPDARCVGAAASPPAATSRCGDDQNANGIGIGSNPSDGCQFTPLDTEGCVTDEDCSGGEVCRPVKRDPNCHPPADAGVPVDGQTCRVDTYCGVVRCPFAGDNEPCDEVTVCNPGTEYDAGIDPDALAATPLDPLSLFKSRPDAGPSAEYIDDPTGTSGKDHRWCNMGTQNPASVQPAETPPDNKSATTKGSPKISLTFDPSLSFKADLQPMPLGETKMNLHAGASLVATVHLKDFLGKNYDADIVDASAGILVQRCSISTKETYFRVFGLDFIDPDDIPTIDSGDADRNPFLYDVSQKCQAALGQYQVWANRAKKAFRDAQQLLHQYHSLKNGRFGTDFCSQLDLAAATVPDFPGGARCYPNESPETTINRFVDYYQAPGIGQVSRLRDAASSLTKATAAIADALSTKVRLSFADNSHPESQTILSAPFAIGPVPMVLEIDVNYSYGIGGEFVLNLQAPLNLDLSPPQGSNETKPADVVHVSANVLPHASASLSAFVGAGFNTSLLSANVGIEGNVTLAEVSAPIFAGAGLKVSVVEDPRELPFDVKPPVSLGLKAFQFGMPKAVKFYLTYDYGAAVDVANVLQGTINGRVRIRFLFFSRTWRKQIARFNGWNLHYDLLKGGDSRSLSVGSASTEKTKDLPNNATSTSVGETTGDGVTMGRSESEVPLTVLSYLDESPPDETPVSDAGVVDGGEPPANGVVDRSKLERVFYDNLCCSTVNEQCSKDGVPQCCPGFECDDSGYCRKPCTKTGDSCTDSTECCSGMICRSSKTCGACSTPGAICRDTLDCCDGLECKGGHCATPCLPSGSDCSDSQYFCCLGLLCLSSGNCGECGANGVGCGSDTDCCGSLKCQGVCCGAENSGCSSKADCCSDLVCGSQNNCRQCLKEGACGDSRDCCDGFICNVDHLCAQISQ